MGFQMEKKTANEMELDVYKVHRDWYVDIVPLK